MNAILNLSKPFLFLFILTLHTVAQANTITIRKVKGKQAVIESSIPLEEGKTYALSADSLVIESMPVVQFRSRYNSISLNLNLDVITGNKTTENVLNLESRYGWNHAQFEFGPNIAVEVFDKGFGTNTNFLVGGYFDYNWVENRYPRELIYGPTVQFLIGNRNADSGASAQLTQLQVSGFLTWFINQSPVALKTEIGYLYRKVNTTVAETTLSGAKGKIFLMYYF